MPRARASAGCGLVPRGCTRRCPGHNGEALGGQPRYFGGRGLPPPVEAPAQGAQMPGRTSGSGRLSGMLLYLAQFDDRLHERGQGGGVVLAGERGTGQQPGRLAQARTGRSGTGRPAVVDPGGPGVGVRRPAQFPAAERAGGQCVGCGPGGVAGGARISGGAAADLTPGASRGAGRVLPDRVPFRRGERIADPWPGGRSVPARAQLGQAQVSGQLPGRDCSSRRLDFSSRAETGFGQPIRRMAFSMRFQKPSKSSFVATSAFGWCPKRLSKSTEVIPLVMVPCVSTAT